MRGATASITGTAIHPRPPTSYDRVMKRSAATEGAESASRLISQRIAELDDWRGETLARVRALIKAADPDIVEEWKWMGTPVWSHDGIVCTGETYKSVVKMTFAKGASLKDPAGLFNSSLEGSTRRAIDISEGEKVDASALKRLIREAVALNMSLKKSAAVKRAAKPAAAQPVAKKRAPAKTRAPARNGPAAKRVKR
jgi:hypothetical protein